MTEIKTEENGKALRSSVTFWGAIVIIAQAGEHLSSAGVNPNDLVAIAGAVGVIYGRIRASQIIKRFL